MMPATARRIYDGANVLPIAEQFALQDVGVLRPVKRATPYCY